MTSNLVKNCWKVNNKAELWNSFAEENLVDCFEFFWTLEKFGIRLTLYNLGLNEKNGWLRPSELNWWNTNWNFVAKTIMSLVVDLLWAIRFRVQFEIYLDDWAIQKAEIARGVSNWTRKKNVWLLINNINMKTLAWRKCRKTFLDGICFHIFDKSSSTKFLSSFYLTYHWVRKFPIVFQQIMIQKKIMKKRSQVEILRKIIFWAPNGSRTHDLPDTGWTL